MKDPRTPAEWQEAVDLALAYRSIHDAKLYGLITGGPQIDVARCNEILDRGRRRGVHPTPDAIHAVLRELVHPEVHHA